MHNFIYKKNIFLYIFLFVFFNFYKIINVLSCDITPINPKINAKSYILMDYNSEDILVQNNSDLKLDPASLTKIMFSYIIGDFVKNKKINLNDKIIIDKESCSVTNPILKNSSLMFLNIGDNVSINDLNKGIVIQSGNDASIALANYLAGSQNSFVDLMNKYASKLGLKNTKFLTVHGLDTKGQYSTAKDIAILSKKLIQDYPNEYSLYKEKYFIYNNIKQLNRNKLLWNKKLNIDGIKTGYTNKAGYNLATSSFFCNKKKIDNMRLISVILGSSTENSRFIESEKLLSWGFRFYKSINPFNKDKLNMKCRIYFGNTPYASINIKDKKSLYITIPKCDLNKLIVSFTFNTNNLIAPIKKNHQIGNLNYIIDNKVVKKYSLIINDNIYKGNIFTYIYDYLCLFFIFIKKMIKY